jgi:hypothetical protein
MEIKRGGHLEKLLRNKGAFRILQLTSFLNELIKKDERFLVLGIESPPADRVTGRKSP